MLYQVTPLASVLPPSAHRGLPQFSEDILRLCVKYRDLGVVGMDIAGQLDGHLETPTCAMWIGLVACTAWKDLMV